MIIKQVPAVSVTEPDISLVLLTICRFQHLSLLLLLPVSSVEPLCPVHTVEPHLIDTPQWWTLASECPDCISIDFNAFKTPQQRTPRYSV